MQTKLKSIKSQISRFERASNRHVCYKIHHITAWCYNLCIGNREIEVTVAS